MKITASQNLIPYLQPGSDTLPANRPGHGDHGDPARSGMPWNRPADSSHSHRYYVREPFEGSLYTAEKTLIQKPENTTGQFIDIYV